MGIHISFGEDQNKEPARIIDPSIDPQKFIEIREKLCLKRKALELDMANNPSQKETYEDDLAFLKTSMKTLGITEIDYIAFLEKQKNEIQ